MEAELTQVLKILVASLLGGVIGWERERRGKSAGIRTHWLVSAGAALFTLVGIELAPSAPSAIASSVVTGLGFLGAGMILRDKSGVHGLNTAASVWATAAVGVAIAAGLYVIAIACAALIFGVSFIPHVHPDHEEEPVRRLRRGR